MGAFGSSLLVSTFFYSLLSDCFSCNNIWPCRVMGWHSARHSALPFLLAVHKFYLYLPKHVVFICFSPSLPLSLYISERAPHLFFVCWLVVAAVDVAIVFLTVSLCRAFVGFDLMVSWVHSTTFSSLLFFTGSDDLSANANAKKQKKTDTHTHSHKYIRFWPGGLCTGTDPATVNADERCCREVKLVLLEASR